VFLHHTRATARQEKGRSARELGPEALAEGMRAFQAYAKALDDAGVLFEVWGAGQYQVAEQLLAEDLIDNNAVPGQPRGRAGDLWAAQAVRKAFPDLQFTLDVALEQDDLVTGRWTMSGTHTGTLDLLGIPPTGRPVTLSGQEIFRARDG